MYISFVKTKQKGRLIFTSLKIVWHVCQYELRELSSTAICRISGIGQVLVLCMSGAYGLVLCLSGACLLDYIEPNALALILPALV